MTITIFEFVCPECGSRDVRVKVIDGNETTECMCNSCGYTDMRWHFQKTTDVEEDNE